MTKISESTNFISNKGECFQVSRLEIFFAQNQIFTLRELESSILPQELNKNTLKNLLDYHLKKGHVIRIRKGLYYTIPKGSSLEEYPVDPYLIASKMAPDAILSYHTALSFHGHLHSVRNDFVFMTQHVVKPPFKYRGNTFKGVSPPKKVAAIDPSFEVELVDYLGIKLRVTSLERTFVDILDRLNLTGSFEEIWKSLESIGYLNISKVIEYVKILQNSTTNARVAFFLDQHRENFGLVENNFKFFDASKPKMIHYFDRKSKEPSKLVKRWNLIVPESLNKKSWEEPYENF
ncbi:MAG: hypothetical protein P0S96_08415 [Simkaniaceae bacterium]|nr:hypothetical protein [Candidatus Sacchlamyda saccharinae]